MYKRGKISFEVHLGYIPQLSRERFLKVLEIKYE